jgi:hypothetical protein
MREKVIRLYQFSELSEEAQKKALDECRDINTGDYFDDSYNLDDFCTICGLIGVELDTHSVKLMNGETRQKPNIWYSVSYCQSDGCCFEGIYRTKLDAGDKVREHAPNDQELHRIADGLVEISALYPEGFYMRIKHVFRGFSTSIESSDANEYQTPEGEWRQPEFLHDGDAKDWLNRLAAWLYTQLRTEIEYQQGDEAVREAIEAIEYEFLEDGTRA